MNKPSFIDIMTVTMQDTDRIIRQLLSSKASNLLPFEYAFKDRITFVDVGPHAWDTEFMLDGAIFLRRRVEGDGEQQNTVYMVPEEGEADGRTIH
jgi:hypothetical protein